MENDAPVGFLGRLRAAVGRGWVAGTPLLALLASIACDSGPSDRVLDVDAVGRLVGSAYVDLDGDSVRGSGDGGAPGLEVAVSFAAGGRELAAGSTDASGQFVLEDLPVGRLELDVDPGYLGDSLRIVELDPRLFTLPANGVMEARIGLSFRHRPIEDARMLSQGTPLFTTGVVLGPRISFGGGTVFLRGEERAIRLLRFPALEVFPGDSVRVRAHVSFDAGQPVLVVDGVVPLTLGATVPTPVETTTAGAAAAGSGTLDADLVRIAEALVSDTATVNEDFLVTVDDGSGPLVIRLRGNSGFQVGSLRPDSAVFAAARGTLRPAGTGRDGSRRWELLPRFVSDVSVVLLEPDPDDEGGEGEEEQP